MDRRALRFEIEDAADESSLPKYLHHLVLVLARAADWNTGVHWKSYKAIARLARVDVRTLRRHLAELDRLAAQGQSPVTIARRHRGSPEGGRQTDVWTIALADPRCAVTEGQRVPAAAEPTDPEPPRKRKGIPGGGLWKS